MTNKPMIVLLFVVAALGGCAKSEDQTPQPEKETSNASKVYDQLPDSSPRLK